MPSLPFQAILKLLRDNPTPPGVPLAEQRRIEEMMALQTSLPADVYTEPVEAGAVPGLLLAAAGADDGRLILYLHGGGYATGSSTTHRDLGWRLSAASGARLLLLDYRRAPEDPFPAAVEDAVAAYRWLLTQGIDPAHIALAGDSAGGGLALAALLVLRDANESLPAAAVCLSPWFDLALTGESIVSKADEDPILSRSRLEHFAAMYLGETDATTPLASPLYAHLKGLPPLLIQAGTAEILLDDAVRLAEKAEAAGVDVTLDVWPEMIHGWQGFAAVLPEGQEAVERIGTFIRRHIG